mgnify:CR=1 FL=1
MIDWKARCIFLLFKCEKLQRRIDLLTSTKSTFYMEVHNRDSLLPISPKGAAAVLTHGNKVFLK